MGARGHNPVVGMKNNFDVCDPFKASLAVSSAILAKMPGHAQGLGHVDVSSLINTFMHSFGYISIISLL